MTKASDRPIMRYLWSPDSTTLLYICNRKTGVVEGYSVTYLIEEWTLLTDELRDTFEWLRLRLTGEFGIVSGNNADDVWIIWNDQLTAPVSTYTFDQRAQRTWRASRQLLAAVVNLSSRKNRTPDSVYRRIWLLERRL